MVFPRYHIVILTILVVLTVVLVKNTKNLVRGQNRSGGTILVAKICPPRPEMCPLLVRVYQKWSGGYKCQEHSENAILDAMDSFSDEAGDLREEVYQYMMQSFKCYMYLLRCTEGRKRSIRQKATKFVILFCFLFCHCFTKFCSCISVTL